MIVAGMLMSVVLVGILCVVAYTSATYALPLMLGFAVARFAYHTGAGLIGTSFIGLLAAIAGYALVHGLTHEAIPSAIWRQIFCFIGGAFVGVSALTRLGGSRFVRKID